MCQNLLEVNMALINDMSRTFRLYVTHVDGEGHFLKLSGQSDQQSSLMVESLFESARDSLEKGIGVVPPAAIHAGIICAAKYKDGTYYRAKILNTSNISTGLVGVHFIDFGNKDIISLSTIRFLDNYDPLFLKLPGQATDYYLARLMNPSGRWEETLLLKLQSLICYCEYPVVIESQVRGLLPIISLQFKGNDLTTHLVTNRYGVAIPVVKQELLLQQFLSENQQVANWPSNYLSEPQSYLEHVPFLLNQSFPNNPASAMRLHQNLSLPINGNMPPPSMISQRLLVNKVSRNPVSLRAPARQPQIAGSAAPAVTSPVSSASPVAANKPTSPKKQTTYKSKLLEVGSTHKVFVSFAEEGPELFGVQLVSDANKLQEVMDEINRRPHSSLKEPPMIGTVCLGRMSGDRIICRAIVTNLSGSQCKLFFVDFGDTEMVSYYDIFDIPEEFVKPNVFAMRFCLSGVKRLEKGPHLIEMFKQLVNGKILTLKVVSPEGPPLIQYGELYLDNNNVFDLLTANMKEKLQFKYMDMLPLGTKQAVLVSYVDSCIKFFVQPSEMINDLNAVMDAVRSHCENSNSPGELPVGAACCARFPEDGNWYRARVRDANNGKMVVTYVDYGNEQGVTVEDLRSITPDLIRLPAVAMKCALKGYESRPIETKTSNQLEMLALEKSLTANIVGVLSNDTMLVTLVDETVTPPLDIAKKMMQLSQPRSNIDPKVTTPTRKDAPETFSSPEGSTDERKKSFKRERSFKDGPPRDNEEFGQRGGSFRNRDGNDYKESFDRGSVGRHSEKFRRPDKPDRPERHGGYQPKPSSNASEDSWQEDSPPNRFNKDNFRDSRRKPREMQDRGKPGWKSKDQGGGVGKRLRQAAEIASMESQIVQKNVVAQERLKRDNRFNSQNDRESNENRPHRDNRFDRSDRPDRRDNRGDRNWGDRKDNWGEKKDFGDKKENWGEKKDNWGEKKDNWGDKKENWGDKKENWGQKREFRDRGERNDRPQSNFTPRDRADRSYEQDKRSERSFRSNDSGGQAPPYKPRSKFTQVQYKELSEPMPLDAAYLEPSVEVGAQHEVSVTWLISPENFYTQILSHQAKFLEMMHQIPELYKGVKSYTGNVPVGASVLARYPADGVLYRATVVSAQPFNKFIVRYVDFGNKQLVDYKDIWQLEKQLTELPKMAVHCSLIGVAAKDGEWKSDPEVDLCFNAPRYQCVFQEMCEDQHKVSLWNNGVSVADMLVEKQLAVKSEHQSDVTLKDEAIDLTIIAGQQILCKITYVESFEVIYLQLDLDKVALVEESIANYDASQLTPVPAESLSAGVHCTVKHEGKIYRAILSDTSDATQIKAVLPDYGIPVTVPAENLMILPKDLTQCYYQSLKTSLNNYTEESKQLMTLDELKDKLTNNKFIIYINDVQDVGLISTFYDATTGKKIEIFEPDTDAYPEVVPFCSRTVFNYNFGNSYISHAENLNEIYLQKAADGDRIAQLLDDLYKFYEEGTPEALEVFDPETQCVAKSSDSNWYRASIFSSTDTEVKVQFSDYGNSETVPKESLKKLDTQFYQPCAMALVVGLGLVALQEDSVSKLVEWTNEKEVQVTLGFGDDGWLASLHLDGVDLSMKLVNEKLATPRMNVEAEKLEAPVEEAESIVLPSGCNQVYISHIDTPGHFWLQMADKVDQIEEIQAKLQSNAQNYTDVENLDVGTLCIAKYSADDQWYRAEILDSDSDITTVRFIDYGNTDVLDNQPGVLKAMPDELKETERLAIKASVNAIPSGTGQWSEPASDYFTQLIGDLANPVDVLIVLKDVTTYVDIYVNGQNITDKLVSEGHANRSEETTECGALPSCFASHVNSPSEFWIQLENATAELQAVEAAMVDAENFPELTDKEEGVICAAKYPEDGAWYRAQVIVDGSEGTEVLFMDYGNASMASELRSLPDELKTKPALSRKCALQKPRDIKSWSRKSEVKFNELAAEGATIFNVQFIAAGDISIVELFLNGKSVTEELIGLCEELPAIERPAPIGEDLRSTGKLCYVNSAEEFYIQLDSSTNEIDRMLERLAAAEAFEPAKELKVGSLCAAFWTEDEQWYRARVLEFCDVGYHVQFIDYGNKAKCEEFMQLPEDIAVIEPLSKCCRLAGIGDDNSFMIENIKNKLEELMAEDSTFQIEFLDSTKEPTLVKLLLDDKDIISLIDSVGASSEPLEITGSDVIQDHNEIEELEITDNEKVASSTPVGSPKAMKETEVEETEVENNLDNVTDSKAVSEEPNEEPLELETSNQDLNESGDSSHTVIENKSFEGQSLSDELAEELNKIPPAKDSELEPTSEKSPTELASTDSAVKEIPEDELESSEQKSAVKEIPEETAEKVETEVTNTTPASPEKEQKSPEKDLQDPAINNDETIETKDDTEKTAEPTKPAPASPEKEQKSLEKDLQDPALNVDETIETKDDTEKTAEPTKPAPASPEKEQKSSEKDLQDPALNVDETIETKDDTEKTAEPTKPAPASPEKEQKRSEKDLQDPALNVDETIETKDDTEETAEPTKPAPASPEKEQKSPEKDLQDPALNVDETVETKDDAEKTAEPTKPVETQAEKSPTKAKTEQ